MSKEKGIILKKDAPKKETTPDEKAEKQIDVRKELTPEEAQRLVDIENGVVTEEKITEPTEKAEVNEGETKATVVPDRYKGKTPEELVKLLDEKENYIQSRSNEIGELKQSLKDKDTLKAKVDEIEAGVIRQSEQQPGNIPNAPNEPIISEDEYYNDPSGSLKKVIDYNKKLLAYTQQYTNAVVSPFYQTDMERKRDKLYQGLETKYKDYPVVFNREKVQKYLDKNPDYFTKYGVNAYEKAFHDTSSKAISEDKVTREAELREKIKKEVLEEISTKNQAGSVGLGDLGTQPINPDGSAPDYDQQKMEDDSEYRKQVLADIEKRNR